MGHNIIAAYPRTGGAGSAAAIEVRTKINNAAAKKFATSQFASQAQVLRKKAGEIERFTYPQIGQSYVSASEVPDRFEQLLAHHAETADKHALGKSYGAATEKLAYNATSEGMLSILQALEQKFGAGRVPAYFTRALQRFV